MHRVGGGASHMIASSSSSMTSDAVLGASHAMVSKSAATTSADAGSTAMSDTIFLEGVEEQILRRVTLSRSAPLWCGSNDRLGSTDYPLNRSYQTNPASLWFQDTSSEPPTRLSHAFSW